MAATAVLRKKRATASHFGNGGDVANLLSEAKLRKGKRRGDDSVASRRVELVLGGGGASGITGTVVLRDRAVVCTLGGSEKKIPN